MLAHVHALYESAIGDKRKELVNESQYKQVKTTMRACSLFAVRQDDGTPRRRLYFTTVAALTFHANCNYGDLL